MWLYSQTQHTLRMEGKNIWGQAGPGGKCGWEAMHGWIGELTGENLLAGPGLCGAGLEAGSMQEVWLDLHRTDPADPSRW